MIEGGTKSQQKYAISMIMFFKKKFNIDPYIEVCFSRAASQPRWVCSDGRG